MMPFPRTLSKFFRLREIAQSIGGLSTIGLFVYGLINKLTYFRVLRAMKITLSDLNSTFLNSRQRYQCSILKNEEKIEFSRDKELEMHEAFVENAIAEGHECFGIFDGPNLAAYAWYSKNPTHISNDLILHCRNDYVYAYKAFTRENYRGQRRSAIRVANALVHYSNQGYKGFISYIDLGNYNSRKCFQRVGYKQFGKIFVLRILRKYIILRTRGCKNYDCWIEGKKMIRERTASPISVSHI